jgi:erythromycin esterase-like protein
MNVSRYFFLSIAFAAQVILGRQDFVVADSLFDQFDRLTIVGLAESTHESPSIMARKGRTVLTLAEQRGFLTVYFEADDSAIEPVRKYLEGNCSGNAWDVIQRARLREALAVREFADVVESWCRWNQGRPSAKKIEVFGIDAFDFVSSVSRSPAGGSATRPFDETLCVLDQWRGTKSEYEVVDKLLHYVNSDSSGIHAAIPILDRCRMRLKDHPEARSEWGISVRFLYEHVRYWRSDQRAAFDARDAAMFENLQRLQAAQPVGRRAIVWAHLAHLVSAGGEEGTQELGDRPLGALLRRWLGDQFGCLAVIAVAKNGGWIFSEKSFARFREQPLDQWLSGGRLLPPPVDCGREGVIFVTN